jgi:hypothetical protein
MARKCLPGRQGRHFTGIEWHPFENLASSAYSSQTPEKNWTRFEQGILGLIHGCISDSDRYLSISPVVDAPLGHTVYDIIRRIEYHDHENLASLRHDLLRAIERQIAGLDKAWEFVCAGFADLQSTAIPDVAVPAKYVYKRSGD